MLTINAVILFGIKHTDGSFTNVVNINVTDHNGAVVHEVPTTATCDKVRELARYYGEFYRVKQNFTRAASYVTIYE